MQIKQILKIPASFFYQMLLDPVLYDVQRYTGHKKTIHNLEGTHYTRKNNNNEDDLITITKVKPDERYDFTSQIGTIKTTTSYLLKSIDASSFELTYSEKVSTPNIFERTKTRIQHVVSEKFKKQVLKRMWNQIEESY